jgi:hypothetical protein
VAGANAAIAATDSILTAFGKVQKQINDLSSGSNGGWTVVILAADYTGNTTAAEDTGLAIDVTTLAINSVYEVEIHALVNGEPRLTPLSSKEPSDRPRSARGMKRLELTPNCSS